MEEQEIEQQQLFLIHMRYELQIPVNAILGYLEMLFDELNIVPLSDFKDDLGSLLKSAKDLSMLIEKILSPTRLEDASRHLDDYVSDIQFNLRTPLTVIMGISELILEELPETTREDWRQDLQKINEAGKKISSTIDDIIHLSKQGLSNLDKVKFQGMSSSQLFESVSSTLHSLKSYHRRAVEKGRLLIVVNNPINREFISRRLMRDDHIVCSASNVTEAYACLGEKTVDLILMDLLLPDTNGYEFLIQLKEHRLYKNIPIILLSELDDLDLVAKCLEAGAEDHIQKPVHPILLRARVDTTLEKKSLRDREQSFLQQIREEQAKSERLLLNVLPRTIAHELKTGSGQIAHAYSMVSVLFVDIIGFTSLSSQLSPEDLVKKLNLIFSCFDDLIVELGAEKIKTIGDSYLVVCGAPDPKEDHAQTLVRLGLRMIESSKSFHLVSGESVQLRVGIHSGPVVAGVIGKRKFSYDLWGDTVNIASRMESHGIPNQVHVTDVTYALINDEFLCEPRGKIPIKGKEDMLTYLVSGPENK